MSDFLIPILVFVAVLSLGVAVVLLVRRNGRPITARLFESDSEDSPKQRQRSAAATMGRIGSAMSLGRNSNALKLWLNRAGYYGDSAAPIYVSSKLMLLIAGIATIAGALIPLDLAISAKIYLIILGGAVMFFMPNVIVRLRINARQRRVRDHLPDAIDLLEVCVSAGMGLDMAWNSVGDEIRRVCPVIADEMALATLEMQLGASRSDALRHLGQRTGADEFSSLVALLVQSERFGTSIADALETFATSMRETRSRRAEERAEKMAVKLLFPLVLFIFPVMLIVMVGPAAMTLANVMGGR